MLLVYAELGTFQMISHITTHFTMKTGIIHVISLTESKQKFLKLWIPCEVKVIEIHLFHSLMTIPTSPMYLVICYDSKKMHKSSVKTVRKIILYTAYELVPGWCWGGLHGKCEKCFKEHSYSDAAGDPDYTPQPRGNSHDNLDINRSMWQKAEIQKEDEMYL